MDTQTEREIRPIQRKKRKRSRFATFLSILSIASVGGMSALLYTLGLTPEKLSIVIFSVGALLILLMLFWHVSYSHRLLVRLISCLVIICLGVACGFGSFFVYKADQTLSVVTQLTNKKAHKINLITMQGSEFDCVEKLEGQPIGVSYILDEEGTKKELKNLEGRANFEVVEYDNLESLIMAWINGEVSAIILNEVFRGDAQEKGDEMNMVNTTAWVIDEYSYYTKNTNKPVEPKRVNVTQQPFTVLVSGNDSYGTLNEVSRSDVNMLLTVNPKTNTVLITNVSRDAYVPIACGADSKSNCGEGMMDKLTHTGLDGISTTEKTIENLLDIDINYNVRINFSSFKNIVDAIGGIDVYVEEGCEVDVFYANGTKGVKAGWNHLDGSRALGFVRERYAYMDGTNQRVRNQQEAIRALISKVCSVEAIQSLNKMIDALNSAFETNMSSNEIKSIIRNQFTFFPEWKFEGYSMRYSPGMSFCYYLQQDAYVDFPLEDSIEIAKQKIDAVLHDKSADTIEDPYEEEASGSYDSASQAEIIQEGEMENAMR